VVGCGDGGQGFKFLPMIGEVLADLAEDRPPRPDTEIFRLSRFG
jgi:sarcosine oxidase